MKKDSLLTAAIFVSAFLSNNSIYGQKEAGINSLQQIITSVDSFNNKLPAEQLYLHLDKPYYAVGDTIWFKAYLFERATHDYSPLSGLLYVDLISDSNVVAKRMSFPVSFGVSWGQIELSKESVDEGNYTIRAYTRWMQNFGEDYFFHQPITINDSYKKRWLVKENDKVISAGNEKNVDIALQLTTPDNQPAAKKPVVLSVLNGKKQLYKTEVQTNADGIVNGSFSVPANVAEKNISITAVEKDDPTLSVKAPLLLNRPENVDLQFMPEGGSLVAGITSIVGFKAVAENGLGADIQGKIVDSKNATVTTFKSLHKGMGRFEFKPVAGENYNAVVNLPDGESKSYSLPVVKRSGVVMRLDNDLRSDSVKVSVMFSPDMVNNQVYRLLGLSRGVVCFAASIRSQKDVIYTKIAKSAFPSGVAHFTLMNTSDQPLTERLLFINRNDNLAIRINTTDQSFATRDSIPLHISVKDKDGKPVVGTFSIAVTDDATVKADSVYTNNIVSRMLLTSDVKGIVESPEYYMNATNTNVLVALDNLLLTQGWVGYNWPEIFKPAEPLFSAERKFTVTGKVTNLLNKGLNKADVVLMSTGAEQFVKDTTTNSDGRFVFTNFTPTDNTPLFIQTRNAKGNNFGIDVKVDEFKPAEIKHWPFVQTPWYVNSDSITRRFADNSIRREGRNYRREGNALEDVTVRTKRGINGSFNLNGPGEADLVIDEKEIVKAGKASLLDVLFQKLPGLRENISSNGNVVRYKLMQNDVFFIIDGVSLNRFGSLKTTLQYIDASDVKGIEVMYNMQHTSRYRNVFLKTKDMMNLQKEFTFIEITTRSGNGIFSKKIPGVTLFKPVPVTLAKQFYSPRYSAKTTTDFPEDFRSTIFWKPNIVTNKQGEANVDFYSAGTPSTYTIILQGSDMNGSVGYETQKLIIR